MPEFSRRGVAGVSSFWNSAPRFSFFTGNVQDEQVEIGGYQVGDTCLVFNFFCRYHVGLSISSIVDSSYSFMLRRML